MGSSDKAIDEQLQELWEEQGEKIGVPQGVRDLLNSAFAKVPVSSFPKLPYGKGQFPFLPYMASSHSHACNQIVTLKSMHRTLGCKSNEEDSINMRIQSPRLHILARREMPMAEGSLDMCLSLSEHFRAENKILIDIMNLLQLWRSLEMHQFPKLCTYLLNTTSFQLQLETLQQALLTVGRQGILAWWTTPLLYCGCWNRQSWLLQP
jgi:hypothetical protein